MKVKKVQYHRNGVGGEGFYVVLFTFRDDMKGKVRHMVATYRPACNKAGDIEDSFSGDITVLDLDECRKGRLTYEKGYCNQWRGDQFESFVRQTIIKGEKTYV